MLKFAICDDEALFREKERKAIIQLLEEQYAELEYSVSEYQSGEDLLSAYIKDEIDMIFLDIELNEENGFEIARKLMHLRESSKIVFVSSHENLVFDSFVCRPVGFIRKRIFTQELSQVMSQIILSLIEEKKIIQVGAGTSVYPLMLNKIRFIDTFKHNICIKMENGELTVRDKLSRIEETLLQNGFVKLSRGSAVNLKYIKKISTGTAFLLDGSTLPISRNRIKNVEECYKRYISR